MPSPEMAREAFLLLESERAREYNKDVAPNPKQYHARIDQPGLFLVTLSSLAGTIILIGGITVAIASHYTGDVRAYSPLNHFVSELGWRGRSPMAAAFNASVTAGSLLFIPVILALGRYSQRKLGAVAAWFGVSSAIAGGAVGLLPMNNLGPHLVAALIYFTASMASITLFTAGFWKDRADEPARVLVRAGTVSVVSSLAFLLYPKTSVLRAINAIAHHQHFERPTIWVLAAMEWVAILSAGAWIIAATWAFWREARRGSRPFEPL